MLQQSTAVQATEGKVLVVDDDGEILSLVAKFLRANGFVVSTARNGAEMKAQMQSSQVDLVVLDIMLPGTNGLDLCRALRAESTVPVVMLTAKGDEIDRIVGLEVGADDYLPKPFNPRELLARIKAVLRRSRSVEGSAPQGSGRSIEFEGWHLDTLKRELVNPGGVVVDLSGGEYDLLMTFLEAPQRVLSRDYLLDSTKNRTLDVFDRSIDVQVSRLRRKIEAQGELIKTIRGAGYLFAAAVRRK
ncbi:response regulator [Rhodobacteraceae bacterium HSP-20]|jgi:two-component system OmpR family response regulator|uniref:Regulatory protein VirG n=2 Tax=Paracoccaceae TaxID=31989 RepID=A0A3S8UCR6_9RHOB|nr:MULTISPECIES: response regulator [Paracoccaceae]AZL61414.1 response regulator [Tabrizicola piscis]MBU9699797.1 response regulator [Rhodobacter amnigenus]MBV4391024.1 response regulator [Rhodobacter amnigenus]